MSNEMTDQATSDLDEGQPGQPPDIDVDTEAAPETIEATDEGQEEDVVEDIADANVVFPASSPDDKALAKGITNIGRNSVTLPGLAQQRAGFKLDKEQAAIFVGQFPQYKFLEPKGRPGDKQTISL